MSKKIVSVVGATGGQSRSVVNTLLKESKYSIRAIIRNPDSERAKALASHGVEVVRNGLEKAVEIEFAQGINIAKAAAATETRENYV